MKRLREWGWTCAVVEKNIRIPGGRMFKRDLFGGDVLAIKPGVGNLLVQCCAGASHANRRAKVVANDEVLTWLSASASNSFVIMSWSKTGARGKRKLWTSRVESFTGTQIMNERGERRDAEESR